MAVEQSIGDDGFHLTLLLGFQPFSYTIERSAIRINFSDEGEHFGIGGPDEFADACRSIGYFPRAGALGTRNVNLRSAIASRKECDLFAISRPSRCVVVFVGSD